MSINNTSFRADKGKPYRTIERGLTRRQAQLAAIDAQRQYRRVRLVALATQGMYDVEEEVRPAGATAWFWLAGIGPMRLTTRRNRAMLFTEWPGETAKNLPTAAKVVRIA